MQFNLDFIKISFKVKCINPFAFIISWLLCAFTWETTKISEIASAQHVHNAFAKTSASQFFHLFSSSAFAQLLDWPSPQLRVENFFFFPLVMSFYLAGEQKEKFPRRTKISFDSKREKKDEMLLSLLSGTFEKLFFFSCFLVIFQIILKMRMFWHSGLKACL